MILCGPTGSGKSRSLSTLVDALAKLETPSSVSMVSEHAQSEHSGNTTMGAVSHRLVFFSHQRNCFEIFFKLIL